MKKICFVSLLLTTVLSPTLVQAENTDWHKIGRIKSNENGTIYVFNESGGPWFNSASNCQGTGIRLRVTEFPLVGFDTDNDGSLDSAVDAEGFRTMVAQVMLAVGTNREVRFTNITCPASLTTSSVHPINMETR